MAGIITKRRVKLTFWGIFATMCVAAAVYIGLVLYGPAVHKPYSIEEVSKKIEAQIEAEVYSDMVIIPKIGVSVPFSSGGEEVMYKGAWHRFPERGDPEKGGNFILSAHRFQMGWNPKETSERSPFYNIGQLDVGDKIEVVYGRQHYTYLIAKEYRVEPEDTYIEEPSKEARLTLYSCTLEGEADGRDVLEAHLVGAGSSDLSSR